MIIIITMISFILYQSFHYQNGISPLHLAAKEGNVKIADALLDNGASPGIQTKVFLLPVFVFRPFAF